MTTTPETTVGLLQCPACSRKIKACLEWRIDTPTPPDGAIPTMLSASLVLVGVSVAHDCRPTAAGGPIRPGIVTDFGCTFPLKGATA